MKQFRPTIEQLKQRYSMEMARRKMLERRHAQCPELATRKKIPDNSEPWLPHLPRSLEECMWISDQITQDVERWKLNRPQTSSSTP